MQLYAWGDPDGTLLSLLWTCQHCKGLSSPSELRTSHVGLHSETVTTAQRPSLDVDGLSP